jgi:hypothetical protein
MITFDQRIQPAPVTEHQTLEDCKWPNLLVSINEPYPALATLYSRDQVSGINHTTVADVIPTAEPSNSLILQ